MKGGKGRQWHGLLKAHNERLHEAKKKEKEKKEQEKKRK